MTTGSLFASLFRYKAWANEELFASVRGLPAVEEGKGELHAAIRVLNHVYVVDRIFLANLHQQAHTYTATNTVETPSLDALHVSVRDTDHAYLGLVEGLGPSELAESIEFSFTDGARARMTREEMLAHVITHGGYHRGAVGRILVQASITPPRDTFTVFLHRSEPERRERS